MGLFEDLPPPSQQTERTGRADATKEEDEPSAKRIRSTDAAVSDGSHPRSALKTKKAEGDEGKGVRGIEQDGDKGSRKVRFRTTEEVNNEQVLAAMTKIAAHIGNISKFSKASKLALQLLKAGSINSSTSSQFFEVLKAAMSKPTAAVTPDVQADYQALFVAASECSQVFSSAQQAQLEVWLLWADLANELHTDDTYQFSRATSRIRQAVEALPEASPEEDQYESLAADTEDGSEKSCQPQGAGGEQEVEAGPPADARTAADDPFGLNAVESDPFGLSALLPKKSKKEERARRKREEEAEQQRAAQENLRLLRERREALIFCLQKAAELYRLTWAQTTIDILAKHAYDNMSRFTSKQRQGVDQLWTSVRTQQARRRQGKGVQGKLDVTAFERLQERYSKELISIRRGVGSSGGRSAATWLG